MLPLAAEMVPESEPPVPMLKAPAPVSVRFSMADHVSPPLEPALAVALFNVHVLPPLCLSVSLPAPPASVAVMDGAPLKSKVSAPAPPVTVVVPLMVAVGVKVPATCWPKLTLIAVDPETG